MYAVYSGQKNLGVVSWKSSEAWGLNASHLGVLRALRDQKMFTSTVRRCLVGNYRTKSPEGIFIACRCLGSAVAGVPIKEPQQLVRVKKNNKLQQQ